MTTILIYISCGLAFTDSRFDVIMKDVAELLGWTLLIITLLTLCVALVLFLLDMHGVHNAARIRDLVQHCARDVCRTALPELRTHLRQSVFEDGTDSDVQQWLLGEMSEKRPREELETNEHSILDELENAVSLGKMDTTDVELLKVLGSVNGCFDPSHLESVLFPEALPVAVKWTVKFENGEIHRYTEAQLTEKFGVSKVAVGMLVQHETHGTGTVARLSKMSTFGQAVDLSVVGNLTSSSHHVHLTARQRTAINEALAGDELSATFESIPFLMWAEKKFHANAEKNTHQLLQYITTNKALYKWVQDGAKCSVYAHDEKSRFFRWMIEQCPFVLDALLEGSSVEVEHFTAVMDWMYAAMLRHSDQGSLSRLIVDVDRAPLARYLADSATDGRSRAAVLSLLHEIWQVFAIGSRIKTKQLIGFVGR